VVAEVKVLLVHLLFTEDQVVVDKDKIQVVVLELNLLNQVTLELTDLVIQEAMRQVPLMVGLVVVALVVQEQMLQVLQVLTVVLVELILSLMELLQCITLVVVAEVDTYLHLLQVELVVKVVVVRVVLTAVQQLVDL
jgi:hypothetical protein